MTKNSAWPLTFTVIPPDLASKHLVPLDVVRSMYELMGSNMTEVIPGSAPDWREESHFQKWRSEVFLGDGQRDTCHLLLSDGTGLRGFLSYTPSADGDEIYINELQIRPSCQCDAVTIRRLLAELARRVELLPHIRLKTYVNKANQRSQRLVMKIGFRRTGQSARGYSYEMTKQALLGWRGAKKSLHG